MRVQMAMKAQILLYCGKNEEEAVRRETTRYRGEKTVKRLSPLTIRISAESSRTWGSPSLSCSSSKCLSLLVSNAGLKISIRMFVVVAFALVDSRFPFRRARVIETRKALSSRVEIVLGCTTLRS